MWIDEQIISQADSAVYTKCFFPKNPQVVLGRANHQEAEVFVENCINDNVPILKRLGGGGTVFLSQDSLVVSLGLWLKDRFNNQKYFNFINQSIIQALDQFKSNHNIKFYQDGISDICFDNKKFCGTSMFRSRNYLLFQASLLFKVDLLRIESYLRQPKIQPKYRDNRPHKSFLVGLCDIDFNFCNSFNTDKFQSELIKNIKHNMRHDLIDPIPEQISHVKNKLKI